MYVHSNKPDIFFRKVKKNCLSFCLQMLSAFDNEVPLDGMIMILGRRRDGIDGVVLDDTGWYWMVWF